MLSNHFMIRGLAVFGTMLAAIAILAIAGRVLLATPAGIGFVGEQLDGREVGPGWTVDVSGLSGDALGGLHIERIQLRDDAGVWFRAEDIDVEWRPLALLTSGTLQIGQVRIERASLLRRPPGEAGGSTAPGPAMAFVVGALEIQTFEIDAAVSGVPAVFEVSAALSSRQAGAELRFAAATTDGRGDRLTAELTWPRGGVPSGVLEIVAPAGSVMSSFVAMPGSDISARLSFPTGDGPGEIRLMIDDDPVVSGAVDHRDDALSAALEVDARRYLRGRPDLAGLAGARPIRIDLVYGPDRVLRADAAADQWSGRFVARARSDWAVDGRIAPELLQVWVSQLDSVGPVSVRAATGSETGVYEIGLETGGLRVGQTATGTVRIGASVQRAASGNLVLAMEGEVADVEDSRLPQPLTLLLTASGEVDPEARRVALRALDLSSELANVNVSLAWAPDTGLTGLAGRVDLHDIEPVVPQLSGPGQLTFGLSEAGGLDIAADLARLNWPGDARGMLDELLVAGRVRSDERGWFLQSVEFTSGQITARAERDELLPNRHNLRGQASLVSATLPGGLLLAGAVSADFVIGYAATGVDIQLLAGAQQMSAGSVLVSQPRLAFEGMFAGGNLAGQVRASGGAGGQAVTAVGLLSVENADFQLEDLTGRFGDLQFAASVSSASSGIELRAQTRSPSWSAEIEALLPARSGSEPNLTAHARGESVQVGAMTLNAFELAVSGPSSAISIEAAASGYAHRPFDANIRGQVRYAPGELGLDLSGDGDWAGFPVVVRDLSGRWDSVSQSLQGELDGSFDTADLNLAFASMDGSDAVVSADATGLPAQLLAEILGTQPVLGEADLNGRFVRSAGVWEGESSLVATGLRKPEYVEFPGMELVVRLLLAENASLTGRLAANALEVAVDVTAPNSADLLGRLGAGDLPTETFGNLALEGNLDALDWAMPADIDVAGRASGQISAAMESGRPSATGTFVLDDGRVVLADAGTRLEALTLSLSLDGPEWRIMRGSASDGATGRLQFSGGGRFDDPGGNAFEIAGDFSEFRWLNRDDARIVASGDWLFARSGEQDLLSGSARIMNAWLRPSTNGPASVARMPVEEINLPDDRARISYSRRPALLDYRVTADRTIETGTRFFNSRWSADIHVGGDTRRPHPTGSLRLSEGNILIFNRRFSMESGEAVLAERLEDSRFDVRAVHRGEDLDTHLRLHGPLDTPVLELTSSPELPQDEIVARLLFGRSAGQLGPLEAAELAAQLSGRSSLNLVGRLREIAQLDRLQVETGGDALRVAAGRDFGERVSVDIEHAGTGLFDTVTLAWTVTRDIEFLSRVTGDTNGSVALVWSREY